MLAVSNSSPLILFARIARLDLLREVFGEIIVPPAVWTEVVIDGAGRPGAAEIARTTWIHHRDFQAQETDETLIAALGRGEAEAIALALELRPHTPLLLDDRKARLAACGYGLWVMGSAAVLITAKERGVIPAVRPLVTDLRLAGLFLSATAVSELFAMAEE